MTDPIIERLTGYVASEVVHKVRRLAIDSMGCALAVSDAGTLRGPNLCPRCAWFVPATLLGTTDTTWPPS